MRCRLLVLLILAMASLRIQAEDHIMRFDPALDAVLADRAEIHHLADSFTWAEGPAWDKKRHRLYFSDVPQNRAYVWSADKGLAVFLDPAGHPEKEPAGFREPGSNGLMMTRDHKLLIANHGTRAIELLDVETGKRRKLVDTFGGKRLNSPNDIAHTPDGTILFTDPPYGLEGMNMSPLKELAHNGVYALDGDGGLSLIDNSLSFPNGLAVSPDGSFLYVAVSDPASPRIYRYRKTPAGYQGRELFFDGTPYRAKGWPGLPDGMAVAETGHIFATGPGGVFVLSPDGTVLGLIRLDRPTANCAFGADGRTLFITSADRLLAVHTRVLGADWRDSGWRD